VLKISLACFLPWYLRVSDKILKLMLSGAPLLMIGVEGWERSFACFSRGFDSRFGTEDIVIIGVISSSAWRRHRISMSLIIR